MLDQLMLMAIPTGIYPISFAPMSKTAGRGGGGCKAKAVAEILRAIARLDIRSESVVLTSQTCFLAGLQWGLPSVAPHQMNNSVKGRIVPTLTMDDVEEQNNGVIATCVC